MATQADPSAFNWMTALASWAGALVIALVAALVTYRGTVKAGREQAIETEKLRLEFSLVEQRSNVFFGRADRLAELVADVPDSPHAAVTFFNSMPSASKLLSLAADRLTGDHYVRSVSPIVSATDRECHSLFQLLRAHGPDPEKRSEKAHTEIADCSHRFLIALNHLMRAADVLAEAAVQRLPAQEYTQRLQLIRSQVRDILSSDSSPRRGASPETPGPAR